MDEAAVEIALGQLRVRAWRLHLETPEVHATVPMLRGVWGKSLKSTSEAAYRDLFDGDERSGPRYLMRPAPPEAQPSPALDFVVFGDPGPRVNAAVWSAWDDAARSGLGRDRHPFRIVAAVPLAWDETPLRPARAQPGFPLAPLPWPTGDPAAACRLDFPAPLRILRRGQLIKQPAPADLALAALRRVHALAGPVADALWGDRFDWLEAARTIRHRPWQGRRLDLVRYSGSQRREIELQGVVGSLDLPDGPRPLAPLLAAAQWLHLGKGTVMGLGQLRILPMPADQVR